MQPLQPNATCIKNCVCSQISTVIMIRNRIVKAVLIFYLEALIYKGSPCFNDRDKCPYQNYTVSFC